MNYVNLVITGNPGVGKHTIADLFVKQNSSYQIFDINKFAIEKGLGEQTDDGIEVDTKKLKNEIQKLNLEKSLIVGHLAPYVLDESNIEYVIILRKNPYELIKIYEKRNYSDKKKNDNLGSEILGIIAYDSIQNLGEDKTFQINTTSITAEETAKKIESVINRTSKGDVIDWLADITQKNDLKKFFPD